MKLHISLHWNLQRITTQENMCYFYLANKLYICSVKQIGLSKFYIYEDRKLESLLFP
jgi:hypothetical protein